MENLDPREIKKFYNGVDEVWPQNDRWHDYNQAQIKKYIHKSLRKFLIENRMILNAGSGGNNYDIKAEMYHVDIVENKIRKYKNNFVGSIEDMPFNNDYFDIVICVGSVINYCDAAKAIRELTRVLKHNGILILEFENSSSFEFRKTPAYRANVSIVTTSYFGKPHKIWVYSLKYITKLLFNNNIRILNICSYHILSSLIYYYTKNENVAAKYTYFDVLLRHIPVIRNSSGNILLLGKKI